MSLNIHPSFSQSHFGNPLSP